MTNRERLIALQTTVYYMRLMRQSIEECVDHLIACGVIVPPIPIKVGQKVYTVPRSAIREWTVCGIWNSADEKCSYALAYYEKDGHHMESLAFNFSDFGKTVFLSREEAENALAERSAANG